MGTVPIAWRRPLPQLLSITQLYNSIQETVLKYRISLTALEEDIILGTNADDLIEGLQVGANQPFSRQGTHGELYGPQTSHITAISPLHDQSTAHQHW